MSGRFTWRKLSAAKWEDVWWDRLSAVSDRLAITKLAGAKTIRLDVFHLKRAEATKLERAFGGQILPQKKAAVLHAQPPRPPIRVRGKLIVVAMERERALAARSGGKEKLLLIPAGMAFGTGDHATTSTCLRFLADVSEEFAGEPWELLDLGTGSGILALAARLLGARRAMAGDFDPDSVRTTRENARLNSIANVVVAKLDVRKWQPARNWPVVAANLFSGLLIEVAPRIAAATASGGRLIFSGILREQESGVVAAFKRAGFRVDRMVRKGKWVSGLATRRGLKTKTRSGRPRTALAD